MTRSTAPALARRHQPAPADQPASMVTVVPVMPEAAGEARNAIVSATSLAVTGRPSAEALRQRSTPSGHAWARALAAPPVPGRPPPPGCRGSRARRPRRRRGGAAPPWPRRTGCGWAWAASPRWTDDHDDDPAGTEAGGGPVQQGRRGAQAGAVEGVPGGGVEGVPLDVSLGEGVEHDDVGGAHRGGAAVEQVVARGIQCGGVGDVEVGVQGGGPATGRLDVGDRGGGTVGVAPVVHADVVPVLRQHERDDPAQPAAGPGDEAVTRSPHPPDRLVAGQRGDLGGVGGVAGGQQGAVAQLEVLGPEGGRAPAGQQRPAPRDEAPIQVPRRTRNWLVWVDVVEHPGPAGPKPQQCRRGPGLATASPRRCVSRCMAEKPSGRSVSSTVMALRPWVRGPATNQAPSSGIGCIFSRAMTWSAVSRSQGLHRGPRDVAAGRARGAGRRCRAGCCAGRGRRGARRRARR